MNNKIVKAKLKVKDNLINVMRINNTDYISLTDLARYKNSDNPGDVIIKWMSNKSSFDFYSLWEELFNDNFKLAESREFKNVRDYTDVLHLVVLSNLEVLNANMIESNIKQSERLVKLNNIAKKELEILINDNNIIGINNMSDKVNNFISKK
ncbi:MAG: KilA-N domain-containing protein [Bacilli bacterium]|nr:KilA-N domain-containing protein [Bacilli bacterium]